MFLINVLCHPEARGGIRAGSPIISHMGVSCLFPFLFCRKLLVKETRVLKESHQLTQDGKRGKAPSGCEAGGSQVRLSGLFCDTLTLN